MGRNSFVRFFSELEFSIEVKLELGFIIFGNGDVFSDEPNQYIE
jgi:hypothetical protein